MKRSTGHIGHESSIGIDSSGHKQANFKKPAALDANPRTPALGGH